MKNIIIALTFLMLAVSTLLPLYESDEYWIRDSLITRDEYIDMYDKQEDRLWYEIINVEKDDAKQMIQEDLME